MLLQRSGLVRAFRVACKPTTQVRYVCRRSVVCFSEEKPPQEEAAASQEHSQTPEEPAQNELTVESLTKQLEELKTKNTEMSDRLLRALADAENVRRISRQDVQNARDFAISKFAKSLLEVSDNLRRAHESIQLDQVQPETSIDALKSLHEGVVMTEQNLQKVFREYKIEPVGQVGDAFDPNLHDALFEYEDASKEVGTIGQLMKCGYLLNKRVLRPAQVGVIKGKQ